jgi:eukaryotic-like serine/threonine-protein kinase
MAKDTTDAGASGVEQTAALNATAGVTQAPGMPKTLFGYDVIGRIGEGAVSVLYAGTDPKTRQVVVIKHIIRRGPAYDRYIEQLETEFEISKQFTHPVLRKAIDLKYNRTMVRKVVDAGLLLEFFDGVALGRQPLQSVGEVVRIFTALADGLDALHYLRYVHCDLKPNNILTNPNGQVKLIDFGQTSRIGVGKPRIQGTPEFIAPEQVACKP